MAQSDIEDNDDMIELNELNSLYHGICTILTVTRQIQTFGDDVSMTFKVSNDVKAIDVLIFEKGLERFGITLGYWLGHVKTAKIYKNEHISIAVRNKRRELDPKTVNCIPDRTMAQWMECLFQHQMELLEQEAIAMGKYISKLIMSIQGQILSYRARSIQKMC